MEHIILAGTPVLFWVIKLAVVKIFDIVTIRVASSSNVKELELHNNLKVKFK